jgi:L-threonylcarbamoyladenylate synthase
MAAVLRTDTPDSLEQALRKAASALQAGEVVALPTETVYGLAANALDAAAVEKLFVLKGRPAHNPIIVHVAGLDMARRCVTEWPDAADRLAAAFWPGPLTIVLPKAEVIPESVTAGGRTVGIRWPRHPIMNEVIQRCGFPLAAPSANRSGRVSPTTAEHVARSLGERLGLIVDGGRAEVGIESTVVDLSESVPRVLRPGMIHADQLAAVIGSVKGAGETVGRRLRSPGLLRKHYSPEGRLLLWDGDGDALQAELAKTHIAPGQVHVLTRSHKPPEIEFGRACVMPADPRSFARALYVELHRADEAGAKLIVVEAVPEREEWKAVADRLRRAAATD